MAHDLNLDNRFTFHPAQPGQPERYEQLRSAGLQFGQLLAALCPPSPERTRAVNAVDDAVMLGNAAIARHDPPEASTAGTAKQTAPADPMAAVYRERAYLVAHLAALYPSALTTDPAEPDWPVVLIETETGQLSWHIAPDDVPLFSHVPRNTRAAWDGHTTAQKYARLDDLTRAHAQKGRS